MNPLHRRGVLAGWPRPKPDVEEPSPPWLIFADLPLGPVTLSSDRVTQWGPVMGPQGTPWHIINYPQSPRGRVLRYDPWNNGRAFLEINAIGDQADVDLLVKMRVQNGTAQDGPGLIGRWDVIQEGLYVAELFNGTHFRLPRRGPGGFDGAFQNLDVVDWSWTTGVWYFIRFQASGTSLRAAISDDIDDVADGVTLTPPAGWTLQGTDSTFASGLWGLGQSNASPHGYWEWVSWGIDGQAAPIPPD